MRYSHDMSEEKEKGALLPEGWREFEILGCVEHISKKGNEGFKFTFADVETHQEEEVYAIAVKKKRWFLKSILRACDVKASQDGVYDWDIPDVEGRIIRGRVEHQEETWINRNNQEVTTTKHKIVEIKSLSEEIPKAIKSEEKEMEDLIDNVEPAPF